MSEFVNRSIGNRQHSYPDTPRGGGALAFARNYAFGPAGDSAPLIASSPGTEISWGSIDVPGSDSKDIPITPRVTGVILVTGVVSLHNTSTADIVDVQVQVEIGTITPVAYLVPASEKISVPVDDGEGGEGFMVVPFQVEIPLLPVGTRQIVRVLLTADTTDTVEIVLNSTTVEVEEVLLSTG